MSIFSLALALAVPITIQAAPTLAEVDATASELATRMVPTDALFSAREAKYRERYRADWDKNEGAALEAEFPGIMAHTMAAAVAEFRAVTVRRFPELRIALANLIRSRLSNAEIAATLRFLRSEAGAKVLGAAASSIDPAKGITDMENAAKDEVRATIAPADAPAIQEYLTSGAAQKFAAIRAEFRPTIAEWFASVNSEATPLINAKVEQAAAGFVRTRPEKTK